MNPIQILLVEDNPADVEMTQIKMREAKIHNEVSVVRNGEQALEFLAREGRFSDAPRPDLILLDLNLPGKTGVEVLGAVKGHPDWNVIPVVVLTSSESDEDILSAYDAHANAYVRKPVDLAGYRKIATAIDDFWLSVVRLPTRPEL